MTKTHSDRHRTARFTGSNKLLGLTPEEALVLRSGGGVVKTAVDDLPPGRDKNVKYVAMLGADASGINEHQVTQLLRTHHRHVRRNPATDTNTHHVDWCERLFLQEPVVEHGLMGNGLYPFRAGGLP